MGSVDAMMQKLRVNSIAMKAPLSETGCVRSVVGGRTRLMCSFWCPQRNFASNEIIDYMHLVTIPVQCPQAYGKTKKNVH
jgi:hypothetical protein